MGARNFRAGWVICLAVIGALALPTSAGAFVYWTATNPGQSSTGIARANLDGSAVNKRFIPHVGGSGLAVDGAHIYWADFNRIGRANLDAVNQRFIAGSRSCASAQNTASGTCSIQR